MPISDAAVKSEWFRILDRAGAKKKSHREIAVPVAIRKATPNKSCA